jgi:hypothetical protein
MVDSRRARGGKGGGHVSWIRTIPLTEADEKLRTLLQRQQGLYPIEYAEPTKAAEPRGPDELPGIVASHTLIPEALYHAFATFGVLMSPELPLTRRQHELITTVVSLANRCFY